MKTLRNIYQYREMAVSLVRRDLRGRYRGSVLGFLWTFLNPLLQLAVYTFVFSIIMRNNIEDYYLFLFVALIPWIFFSTCVSGGAGCIRDQAALVAKIYFPREILPISYVTSQFVNMLLSFIVVMLVLALSGKGFSAAALAFLPLIMIVEYIMALGFVFVFCGITVYFRDIQYILSIIMMAWQFMTPVMYGVDMVPERLLPLFMLNPMTPIIHAYRQILYYKSVPDVTTLIESVVIGVAFLVIGMISFRQLEKHFAENM